MKKDVGMKTNNTKENNQPLKISYFQHYEDEGSEKSHQA